MAYENTVLSLNPDRQSLLNHESALRENGYVVISVYSPLQARFEIEMGRCGIFLTSYITPFVIYQDLANLCRRSCSGGSVVYLAANPADAAAGADLLLSEQDDPHSIVEKLRAIQSAKAS